MFFGCFDYWELVEYLECCGVFNYIDLEIFEIVIGW